MSGVTARDELKSVLQVRKHALHIPVLPSNMDECQLTERHCSRLFRAFRTPLVEALAVEFRL